MRIVTGNTSHPSFALQETNAADHVLNLTRRTAGT
jgi:hypothetical protein